MSESPESGLAEFAARPSADSGEDPADAITDAARRWRLVEELFHAAAAVPERERGPYLALMCAGDSQLQLDVESLLAFDQVNEDSTGAPFAGLVSRAAHELTDGVAWAGMRVGPYVILREIGCGGMGTVYLAERADGQFKQKVALKVINGFCSRAGRERFLNERQLLANLDHPHIARLLDGGETEQGQPYFVMEYLEGESITSYFARQKSSTAARLEIFDQVCGAVHYAHQKLVIHRDLKPSNILIVTTETASGPVPMAKVFDFGIAKLIDETAPNDATEPEAMTPGYASPEQFLGRSVSTASDVYSLGAVLYEILSGHRPYDLQGKSPAEMELAICQDDPLPLSHAALREGGRRTEPATKVWRELRGDLDKIVAMAMAKEPDRRYGSAQALSEDLRRCRQGFPVRANAGGVLYRWGKLWKRHRLAFAGAALLIVSWLSGTFMIVRESRSTREHEKRERNLAAALLVDAPEQTSGLTLEERTEVVKLALESLNRLAGERRGDPGLDLQRAKAYERIGDLQGHPMASSMGDSGGAATSYHEGLLVLERLAKATPDNVAVLHQQVRLYERLGVLMGHARGASAGIQTMRPAVEIAERALQLAPTDNGLYDDAGQLFDALTRFYSTESRRAEAKEMLDRSCQVFQTLLEREPQNWDYRNGAANCHAARSNNELNFGDIGKAIEEAKENLRLREQLAEEAPNNPEARRNLMIAYARVGDYLGYPVLRNAGDHKGAMVYMRKVLSMAEAQSSGLPSDANALYDLAMARKRFSLTAIAAGDRAEAAPQMQIGWEEVQRLLKTDPTHKRYLVLGATFQERLGESAGLNGQFDDAERYFDRAEALAQVVLDRDPYESESEMTYLEIEGLRLDMETRHMRLVEFDRSEMRLTVLTGQWLKGHPKSPGRAYLYYSAMAKDNDAIGRKDHARQWYEKSLAGWRQMEKDGVMTPLYAKEPERVERALAALNAPASAKLTRFPN